MQQSFKQLIIVIGIMSAIGLLVFWLVSGNRKGALEGSRITYGREVDRAVLISNGRILIGDKGAPVEIAGFFDLASPKSAQIYTAITRLMNENRDAAGNNKILLIYHHFPNNTNQNSQEAAKALEAARILSKFNEMANLLITRQNQWVNAPDAQKLFISYARELGLDEELFGQKLDVIGGAIDSDLLTAKESGVEFGDTLFINGRLVSGDLTYENLKKEVDSIPWPSPSPEIEEATEEGQL